MKKIVGILVFLFLTSILCAGIWSDLKQFQKYKFVKSVAVEADDAGNTFVAVANYTEAAKIAKTYSKIEYSLYQMNSAAFCLIKVYKETKNQTLIKEALDILTEIQNTMKDQNIDNDKLSKDIDSNINFCQDNLK
jgi:hypothetical protein